MSEQSPYVANTIARTTRADQDTLGYIAPAERRSICMPDMRIGNTRPARMLDDTPEHLIRRRWTSPIYLILCTNTFTEPEGGAGMTYQPKGGIGAWPLMSMGSLFLYPAIRN